MALYLCINFTTIMVQVKMAQKRIIHAGSVSKHFGRMHFYAAHWEITEAQLPITNHSLV